MARRKALPELSKRPKRGRKWRWTHCYFRVGQHVRGREWMSQEPFAGRVDAIKVNKFGRVSYVVDGKLRMTEEFAGLGNVMP